MGNTITKSDSNLIDTNTILGKEISNILINKKTSISSKSGPYSVKINKARACCLGVIKENPQTNDFITVKLPNILDENNPYCENNEKCVGHTKLGLQIKGDEKKMCKIKDDKGITRNFTKGLGSKCDSFMVNHCAKSLYDQGCLKCDNKKKKSDGFNKCTPKWDVTNKNCFTKNGTLSYGPEECVCINSQTGYTLNRNPSNSIRGQDYPKEYQNPWGIRGSESNDYTKYSINLFEYDVAKQKPQVFDNRCANRIKSGAATSGKSKAYALPDYTGTPSICMNMIKLGGNSSFGKTQLSNIKQTNNCGSAGGSPPDLWKDLERKKKAEDDIKEAKIAKAKADADADAKAKADAEVAKAKVAKAKADAKINSPDTKVGVSGSESSTPQTPSISLLNMKFSKTQLAIIGGVLIVVIILLIILLSGGKSSKKTESV